MATIKYGTPYNMKTKCLVSRQGVAWHIYFDIFVKGTLSPKSISKYVIQLWTLITVSKVFFSAMTNILRKADFCKFHGKSV
jgi:hypothetical protein